MSLSSAVLRARRPAVATVVALAAALALPAAAEAKPSRPAPLTLQSATVSTAAAGPTSGQPATCDGTIYFNCGTVAVDVTLAGLNGRERPPYPSLSASGTVDVVRTYGCVDAKGRRIHRLDRKVTEKDTRLGTRRSAPIPVPAEGDTLNFQVYAFLLDAQPGQCPKGTEPRLFKITASHVRVTLQSQAASIPTATYKIPGRATWKGTVPTPPLA